MIVIVTDSSAYLTRQEAKDLEVVHVPMSYSIGDEVHPETFILENESFHKAVEAEIGQVTTSQPTMGAFERRFKRLIDAGCEVLCLTISSRLSGTYSNAVVCAEPYGERVRVVDTRSSSAGVYLMVLEAERLIGEGLSLGKVADALKAVRPNIFTHFSVEDLEPLRNSGRLGSVRQSVGTILNQRPILAMRNGAVQCIEMARGKNDQLRKLLDAVPDDATHIIVEYFREDASAKQLAQKLSERFERKVPLRRLGVVLGVHLGNDVVGVTWQVS